jgi:anhydro-N-acetylmuramic acid kinase
MGGLGGADIMATLTRLTAETIADALNQSPITNNQSLYLSGGGAHNPLIVKFLKEKLPDWKIKFMKALGVDGDAKEAVLFAVLANEMVAGKAEADATLGGIPLVGMGKISLPG